MRVIVITRPNYFHGEADYCNQLLAAGAESLHIRKPEGKRKQIIELIESIDPYYYSRLVLHSYYGLVDYYELKGIHVKAADSYYHNFHSHFDHVSISFHHIREMQTAPRDPVYGFLSPLFNSISKPGYLSRYDIVPDMHLFHIPYPVFALGGINAENAQICVRKGFAGVAALGYIWEEPKKAIDHFNELKCL